MVIAHWTYIRIMVTIQNPARNNHATAVRGFGRTRTDRHTARQKERKREKKDLFWKCIASSGTAQADKTILAEFFFSLAPSSYRITNLDVGVESSEERPYRLFKADNRSLLCLVGSRRISSLTTTYFSRRKERQILFDPMLSTFFRLFLWLDQNIGSHLTQSVNLSTDRSVKK